MLAHFHIQFTTAERKSSVFPIAAMTTLMLSLYSYLTIYISPDKYMVVNMSRLPRVLIMSSTAALER